MPAQMDDMPAAAVEPEIPDRNRSWATTKLQSLHRLARPATRQMRLRQNVRRKVGRAGSPRRRWRPTSRDHCLTIHGMATTGAGGQNRP